MPKALVPVAGEPMLARALRGVRRALPAAEIVAVLPRESEELWRLGRELGGVPAGAGETGRNESGLVLVAGGGTRTASVRAGLDAIGADADVVLVHDAARCLAPPEVFLAVVGALEAGATAVVPALPVVDTVKTAVPAEDRGIAPEQVYDTPARSALRAVQTPQGFVRAALVAAHRQAEAWGGDRSEAVTDDAMLMELTGLPVHLVPGSLESLKITTDLDLRIAEASLRPGPAGTEPADQKPADQKPADQSPVDQTEETMDRDQTSLPRIGVGTDVHRFAPEGSDRELWLAGLHWPGERGLEGHSDADAVAHAACDALFSAAGIGDLGTHFGTLRPELAGASGAALLTEAARLVRAAGFEIGNVAVQFVGNRPRFGARREEADRVLSAAAGAPVTVTATTSDGLGYEGAGEGVTAYASALVFRA